MSASLGTTKGETKWHLDFIGFAGSLSHFMYEVRKGWKSAIIVSDPPHLLRLHQTWSRAFEGSSKKFILVPTKPVWWRQILWWKNEKSYLFVMNEIKKNLFYVVVHY